MSCTWDLEENIPSEVVSCYTGSAGDESEILSLEPLTSNGELGDDKSLGSCVSYVHMEEVWSVESSGQC